MAYDKSQNKFVFLVEGDGRPEPRLARGSKCTVVTYAAIKNTTLPAWSFICVLAVFVATCASIGSHFAILSKVYRQKQAKPLGILTILETVNGRYVDRATHRCT